MGTSSNQAMMCLRHSGRSCIASLSNWFRQDYHVMTSSNDCIDEYDVTTLVGGTLLKVHVVATFCPTAYLSEVDLHHYDDDDDGDHDDCMSDYISCHLINNPGRGRLRESPDNRDRHQPQVAHLGSSADRAPACTGRPSADSPGQAPRPKPKAGNQCFSSFFPFQLFSK